MLCQFLLYSEVTEPRIYIYPLFLGFPSYLGHYRAFNRVLCPYSKFSLVIYFIHSINSLCVWVCVCVLSCVQLFVALWTVACQALLSIEFCRQKYWSGLSFPSSRDLPNPGIKLTSPVSSALAGGFFTTELPGEPIYMHS